MDYEDFASALLDREHFVFRSALESEQTMNRLGVSQTVRQLGNGRFRSDVFAHRYPQADFFSDRFNKGVSIGLEVPVGMVGFLFPRSASGKFRVSGHDTGTDKLIVALGGTELDIFVPDFAGSEAIVISAQKYQALFGTLCPEQTAVGSNLLRVVDGDSERLRRLRSATLAAARGELNAPGGEDVEGLLSGLATWISESSQRSNRPPSPTRATRARIAKLAQGYLEGHYRETVSSEMICRATDASVRSLQRCFLEQFGVTISEYLKTIRLEAAWRDLTATSPGEDTVAKIAVNHGLRHFGRFSVQYRQRYGESPSMTLARPG